MGNPLGKPSLFKNVLLQFLNRWSLHTRLDTNPGIHNPAALSWWQGKDWVQIEFTDLGNFFDEA